MDNDLTLKEAAPRLHLETDTLRKYAEKGKIPAIKRMGRWILSKEWVEEKTKPPGQLLWPKTKNPTAKRDGKNAQNQIEHIMKIRELAIIIRAKVQAIPRLESDDCLGIVYVNLTKVAFELVTHPYWIWLSAHLGDKAKEIELLADGCGENIIKVSIVENEKRINDAKQLLTDSLYPIAFYGDTKEWKAWGLKATCPCPCCSDNI